MIWRSLHCPGVAEEHSLWMLCWRSHSLYSASLQHRTYDNSGRSPIFAINQLPFAYLVSYTCKKELLWRFRRNAVQLIVTLLTANLRWNGDLITLNDPPLTICMAPCDLPGYYYARLPLFSPGKGRRRYQSRRTSLSAEGTCENLSSRHTWNPMIREATRLRS